MSLSSTTLSSAPPPKNLRLLLSSFRHLRSTAMSKGIGHSQPCQQSQFNRATGRRHPAVRSIKESFGQYVNMSITVYHASKPRHFKTLVIGIIGGHKQTHCQLCQSSDSHAARCLVLASTAIQKSPDQHTAGVQVNLILRQAPSKQWSLSCHIAKTGVPHFQSLQSLPCNSGATQVQQTQSLSCKVKHTSISIKTLAAMLSQAHNQSISVTYSCAGEIPSSVTNSLTCGVRETPTSNLILSFSGAGSHH